MVSFFGFRCETIPGHNQIEVPHIGIVGGVKDADIAREAAQDERARAQVIKKDVQRRRKETGMLWLEDEVIVFLRNEQASNVAACLHPVFQTMMHVLPKIGLPPSEVVVDVDGGHAVLALKR